MSRAFDTAKTAIKRDKFLSTSIILTLTITFLILGSFISTFVFTQTAIKRLEDNIVVSAYFKNDFPENRILSLQKKLQSDPRVKEVKYVSKEQAFKIFTELNKGDELLLESVTASILPASIEVKTVLINDIEVVSNELSSIDGVEDVRFFKGAVDNFKSWSNLINLTGSILVVVFLIVSFSIVVVALRLTISSKSEEISILKLVGASDSYIKNPLVYQALLYAVISAFISSLILFLVLNFYVFGFFAEFESLNLFAMVPGLSIGKTLYSVLLFVFLSISSIVLGYLGSLTAIKKYLNL